MRIKPDVKQLEANIKQVRADLAALADDSDMSEVLDMIHRPGWTTPAESVLVSGVVESLRAHTQLIVDLRQTLIIGCRQVSSGVVQS